LKKIRRCGIFFNRHKWKDIDEYNRICEKCGECQTHYLPTLSYRSCTFDVLMENVKKNLDKKRRISVEESKRKALEYLKSQKKVKN